MKSKTKQTTTSRDFCKLTKEEKKAFMKFHPMENDTSLKVNDEYKKNLSFLSE